MMGYLRDKYYDKKKEEGEWKPGIEVTLFSEIKKTAQESGYKAISYELLIRELSGKDYEQFMNWHYVRANQVKYSTLEQSEKNKFAGRLSSETDNRLNIKDMLDNFGHPLPALEGAEK